MIAALKDRLASKTRVNDATGCWEWTGYKNRNGYGMIKVPGSPQLVHRMSYQIYCGPIEEGLHVLHRCDNPVCLNPSHLFVGTYSDNMADMVRKNRQAKGSRFSHSKLSEQQAAEIRSAVGVSQQYLAKQYGISQTLVSYIRTGRNWRHATKEVSL